MTKPEIEILLTEKCQHLDLKAKSFEALEEIFFNNSCDKQFLGGFERNEIKPILDRVEFQIHNRMKGNIIVTRIGLYIESNTEKSTKNIESIGYYELETDFNGKMLDDWFVIDKGKRI